MLMRPKCWVRYVDDTFVVWSHGEEELGRFLLHINSIHPQIQFAMETERDQQLAFLDVLVLRRANDSRKAIRYTGSQCTLAGISKTVYHTPGRREQC